MFLQLSPFSLSSRPAPAPQKQPLESPAPLRGATATWGWPEALGISPGSRFAAGTASGGAAAPCQALWRQGGQRKGVYLVFELGAGISEQGYVSVGSGCALGAGRGREPGLSSRGAGARGKSSPEAAAERLPCARALWALHCAPALAAPARWLPSPQQQPQASPRLPRSQHRWKSSCRSSRMKQ